MAIYRLRASKVRVVDVSFKMAIRVGSKQPNELFAANFRRV